MVVAWRTRAWSWRGAASNARLGTVPVHGVDHQVGPALVVDNPVDGLRLDVAEMALAAVRTGIRTHNRDHGLFQEASFIPSLLFEVRPSLFGFLPRCRPRRLPLCRPLRLPGT
jgi:hypothetical protein